MMTFPPVEYLFLLDDQPDPLAWNAVAAFARTWNASHQNLFTHDTDEEWSVVLPLGVSDKEMPVLEQALSDLKASHEVVWFKAVVDHRRPEDYEKAPFVEIVGNTFPDKLVRNWKQATGPAWTCKACGTLHSYYLPIIEPLLIDESMVQDAPGTDLITLPNGAILFSKRMDDLFNSHGVTGYEKIEVMSHQTGQASASLFLMRANKSVLDPCVIHTPREKNNVCPECGIIRGGILGHFHVRKEWLGGDEIFSRNALKYASINVSNRVYLLMKQEKITGLVPAFGIFDCSHDHE